MKNPAEILRLVTQMHAEKKIPKEVIFQGIEAAIQLAAERSTGSEGQIKVEIDRVTGELHIRKQALDANGNPSQEQPVELDPEELGRIAAYSAKQIVIQKIREAEADTLYKEYHKQLGELVTGTVKRIDAGTAVVSLDSKAEAILPRSEQIPGETHHVNQRIKAVIHEVKKTGHRVKIVLSRAHPDFVRALFEKEIPEIEDRTIEIKAVAREAGYRSKVAVSSIDMKVDCVGACVGVRGSRIKNIIDELNNERIDIVRWNDSLQVLIPNALSPAEISEVFLYPRLRRAIVLVTEDQLSLAIGKRGQNVRLASKLVVWDIEIMTHDELSADLARAERWFRRLPHVTETMIESFIEEGFLSYNDLTFQEPERLAEITGLTPEEADDIIAFAEEHADEMEKSRNDEAEQELLPGDSSANIAESVEEVAFETGEPKKETETEPPNGLESILRPVEEAAAVATAPEPPPEEVVATTVPDEKTPEGPVMSPHEAS